VVIVDHVGAGAAVLAGLRQALVKVVFAVVAAESWATIALIRAHRVGADAIIAQVLVLLALVHVLVAAHALPSIRALALVAVNQVLAEAAVQAGRGVALVDLLRAVVARIALGASALEPVNEVYADLAAGADHVLALVNVDLTVEAVKASRALAVKLGGVGGEALALVVAWLGRAGVVVVIAGRPHELGQTLARVPVDTVEAGATVNTGTAEAFVNVDLAVVALKARETGALIPAQPIDTASSVPARAVFTLVGVLVAMLARPADLALAAVASVLSGRKLSSDMKMLIAEFHYQIGALNGVHAGAVEQFTFIDILLTKLPSETLGAVTHSGGRL
jgi:hypothetical protein